MSAEQFNREQPAGAPCSDGAASGTPPLILVCQAGGGDVERVIGSQPVAWHVMKTFAAFGVRRFVVCIDSQNAALVDHFLSGEIDDDWQVSLVNTGENMRAEERIAVASRYLHSQDEHCFIAADTAVANIDVTSFFEQHVTRMKPWTAAVVPAGHDNAFQPARCILVRRRHLPYALSNGALTNGALSNGAGSATDDSAAVYYHTGYWHSAASTADCQELSAVWRQGDAPWTISWPVASGLKDGATKAA